MRIRNTDLTASESLKPVLRMWIQSDPYADTVSAWSLTMRTLLKNFEDFSQILKERSGEKIYLCVFTHPKAII